jgi:oligopeptide/dipeptide ABC transporter ATP-binding protein
LSVVAHTCDEVAVMYLGHIVEQAPSRELFTNPRHPYTKALLSSIPSIDPDDQKKAIELKGEIPSAMNPPSGCVFRTRCPNPTHECKEGHIEMGLIEVSPNHWVGFGHLVLNTQPEGGFIALGISPFNSIAFF